MNIEFKPRSKKDLLSIPNADRLRIIQKIALLQHELSGDIKRLTNFTYEYRLRVGDYRILFDVTANSIIIYRILHRRDAYC